MPRGPHLFEPLERRTFFTVTGGGFSESVIATGLREPTAMVVTANANPDAYITEKAGRLRMFRNGALLSSPIGTLEVDTAGERGLLGIALPRRFALERFIYLCYVTGADSTPNLRISRFPSNGQLLAVDFETVLLELPAWDLEKTGAGLTNLGGGIRFGFDGTLYIGVGDSGRKENAPDLESPFGKILRIKPDGSVPADNPFAGDDGWKKYVWASGLRDPAKIAVHPDVGITYINDPGATKFDEVNRATAGANYGWWQDEGPGGSGEDPIYAGAHQPTNPDELPAGHIAGGAFFSPGTLTFPVPFGGDYFFTDRDAGAIRVMDIEKYQPGSVELFATGLAGPIDIGSTPEGDLLVLTRGTAATEGQIIRYAATGGPAIVRQPRGGSAVEGTTFSLIVAAEGRTPLTYQWRRNGVDIPSATAATYTTGSLTAADDGATFSVVVSNSFGTIASRSATVRVTPAGTDPGSGSGGGGTGGGGSGGGGTGGGGGGGGGVGNPPFPGKPPPEPMGPIDLVPQFITGVPGGAIGGSRGRASLRVFNLGLDTAVGTLTVRLHLSRDDVMDSSDHAVMDAVKMIRVRPTAAKTIKFKFTYPSDAPEGSYQLLAQVDPANTLPETNEANNLAVAGGATELTAPVVDVRTQIGATTTAAKAGANVIVPVTLFNAGNAPSPSADVTIVVSLAPGSTLAGATGPAAAEALATASPVFTRTVRLSLGAGRGKTLKLKFALPADLAAGAYTFAASVDTVNAIAEADETNNTAVAAAAVTVS